MCPDCLFELCPFWANLQMDIGKVGALIFLSGESLGEKFLGLGDSFGIAPGRDLADSSFIFPARWFQPL